MEEFTSDEQQSSGQFKQWLQDNLRIIVSVVIVVAIAGGIYSYSKRGPAPAVNNDSASTEKIASEEGTTNISQDSSQAKDDSAAKSVTAQTTNDQAAKQTVQAGSSQETEVSFVEAAGKGEGKTHLARRALANYLEKNPDSSLTKEHKIYIEDYLRKHARATNGVRVGSSVEFSKDLVAKAIAQSKTLNERQLKNLQKYSARVSTLS